MPETEVYGHLEGLDIAVVTGYLLFSVALGMMFARRGTKDAEAYFVGGRGMSWWLVGISLAATCFAADTPLWVGEIVYKRGLEATWFHWITAVGFSFYVFVIAPLWRRSRIITDLEFLELRYSGKAATWLRGFNSLYYALIFNVMMMGVSTLSITKIMVATTGMDKGWAVLIVMSGALLYCVVSGLWGVAATDFMQFFVTFFGSVVLAGFALVAVGGPDKLVPFLQSDTSWAGHELNVIPGNGVAMGLPLLTIVYLFLFRWWDNAGIGAYVSQRLFAAKSTKDATLGAMLHALVYWSIVPLPWIITIAAARMYMPNMTDGAQAYPRMAMAVLPVGLKGLLIASMLAAFMSTYSSLLSWGSSYAINDFYRRFLKREESPKHYVRVGQLFMVPMALISALIAYQAESIFNLLAYLFLVPAATMTVMVIRWLWWRVNAWAEVVALAGGVVTTLLMTLAYFFRAPYQAAVGRIFDPEGGLYPHVAAFADWMEPSLNEAYFGHKYLFIVLTSLGAWVVAMYLTPAVDRTTLDRFVTRVNPPGFWEPVRSRLGLKTPLTWGAIAYGWAIMLMAIYGPTIGLVKLFFGSPVIGLALIAVGVLGIGLAVHRARRMDEDGFIRTPGAIPATATAAPGVEDRAQAL